MLQGIRLFFCQNGYVEVETPLRIPALAPEVHIDAIDSEKWFLQTSPELCMKRLMAAGYDRIYQICRCFRKKERGRRHLPEMTLLEWYRAGWNYMDMMDECEALIRFVARFLEMGDTITYQGCDIKIGEPWRRLSVEEVFNAYASVSMVQALEDDVFDEVMGTEIEPRLGIDQPVFVYDYPAVKSALARLKQTDRNLAERFELYMGGIELCNAFSELIDPVEQRRRFEAENDLRRSAGRKPYPLSENFLASLQDIPQAAGNALGVDRLAMLFCDTALIDEVVAFIPEEL
jgi:lysyl-tRNA synthetase class 2